MMKKKKDEKQQPKKIETNNMDLSYILRFALGKENMKNIKNCEIEVVATDEQLAAALYHSFNKAGASKVNSSYMKPMEPLPLHKRRTSRLHKREEIAYEAPKSDEPTLSMEGVPAMPPVVGFPEQKDNAPTMAPIEMAKEVSQEELKAGVKVTAVGELVDFDQKDTDVVEEGKETEVDETPVLPQDDVPQVPSAAGLPTQKDETEEADEEETPATEEEPVEEVPAEETPKAEEEPVEETTELETPTAETQE